MDKKDKPRTKKFDEELKDKIFFSYMKATEETNTEKKFSEKGIKFLVLQSVKNIKYRNSLLVNLECFYNENFTGNKEFMHIPSFTDLLRNSIFPILVATRKSSTNSEEIIGTTTIKVENNSSINDNPYFPTNGENILSINGILTKKNLVDANGERIRGIGKELYKIAIRGAHDVNKVNPVRLMCVIDCRNDKSLYSLANATRELNDINIDSQVYVDGYYEILNSYRELVEAPTFSLEIDLDGRRLINTKQTNISYSNCRLTGRLYNEIEEVIKQFTNEQIRYINKVDDEKVIYHRVKPVNILAMKLESGLTAEGNNRKAASVNMFA